MHREEDQEIAELWNSKELLMRIFIIPIHDGANNRAEVLDLVRLVDHVFTRVHTLGAKLMNPFLAARCVVVIIIII